MLSNLLDAPKVCGSVTTSGLCVCTLSANSTILYDIRAVHCKNKDCLSVCALFCLYLLRVGENG